MTFRSSTQKPDRKLRTTRNSSGIVDLSFPLIPELRALLERRQTITRRCERAQGRIIAHVFHRYGRPIKTLRRAWRTACKEAGRPGLLLDDLRRSEDNQH